MEEVWLVDWLVGLSVLSLVPCFCTYFP